MATLDDDFPPGTELPVSVIIPTFNRGGCLVDVLRDLLAQERPPREILVLDQSAPYAPEVRAALDPLLAQPRVRSMRQSPPNAQAARNRGIVEARCEIVLLLDDDIRVGPDFVWRHYCNYLEDPSIDAVAGQILQLDEEPTEQLPDRYAWSSIGWMHLPLNYARRCATINLPSGNSSIRRSVLLRAGGFDAQFTHTWYDDAELSWRIHLQHARAIYDPAPRIVHLQIPSGGRRPGKLNPYVIADSNRWMVLSYFWLKHFRWRAWRDITRITRGCILRKPLLVRPHYFCLAVGQMAWGVARACVRLAQGPRYIRSEE